MRRRLLEEKEGKAIADGALTFTANSVCQVKFTGTTPTGGTLNKLMYSLDGGTTAKELPNNSYISLSTGDTIMFRGECVPVTSTSGGIGKFAATGGTFSASGNVMSLLYGNDFTDKTSLSGKNYAFYSLFIDCTNLSSITGISLPATTLAERCYGRMFRGCTKITTIPSTLLQATTLARYCYYSMFSGCKSLTSIPSGLLPATTLEYYCYGYMFSGCTGLTSIPSDLLPATILAISCYRGMFNSCANITRASNLPATTLVSNCYQNMFYQCSKLNYIKCIATDNSASNCTNEWLRFVASTGTFIKAASMTSWTTGASGIPSGWTVQDA